MKKYLYTPTTKCLALFVAAGLISCDPEFDTDLEDRDPVASGTADFSTYVALGNSLTAGLADNSLYIDGQLASYPNIIAQQMKFAGGGEFTQPLAASNAGGLTIGEMTSTDPCSGRDRFPQRTVLGIVDGERGVKEYTPGGARSEALSVVQGPFNNLGVPGAKSFHLLAEGYGDPAKLISQEANPFFIRMASSPGTSILADAIAQNPTFFTLWIGNNDLLDYATSGGVTTSDNTCGAEITDINLFTRAYGGIIQTILASTEAKGVLVNLPSVTSIPFFTTVPFAPLDPRDENFGPQIPTLNETFAGLNQAFAFLGVPERSITFSTTGPSSVIIKDESLTDISAQLTQVLIGGGLDQGTATVFGLQYGQARQATENDLLLLTSSSIIGTPNTERIAQLTALGVPAPNAGQLSLNGITFPLEDRWVLTQSEQEEISTAQSNFNNVISELVSNSSDRLALFNSKALLDQVGSTGVTVDGAVVNSTFATGGAFSLDGVHLTPRANAIVANGIIDVINSSFGANLQKVQPGTYKTITVE